ncbi:MAG: DNA translocase FtsK [Ruminococcaceae bacterium]|nr:DNA translocase FtsK [Oscillospiraceae bacterium]
MREEEYAAYLKAKKEEEKEARRQAKAEKQAKAEQSAAESAAAVSSAPSVYKVKRRKIEKSGFVNEFADDIETAEAGELKTASPDGQISIEEGENVDEKIFDEVMRRTRERIEKNQRKAEIESAAEGTALEMPEGADAPIILPPPSHDIPYEEYSADELANLGNYREEYERMGTDPNSDFYDPERAEALKKADEYDYLTNYIDSITERGAEPKKAVHTEIVASEVGGDAELYDETDTVKLAQSMGDTDAFDLSGLFVNPGDAELLDRLSEAYIKTPAAPTSEFLTIERAEVGEETKETSAAAGVKKPPEYIFPPIDLLTEDTDKPGDNIREELQENAIKLVETLKSFNVKTKIEDISRGPTITRYELQPEPGTKVRSITNLVDDIALNLATTGVRIEAPIPGKAAVGIEVPNKKQFTVHLRSLIEMDAFTSAKSRLTVCLGENVAGEAVYFDIAKMPHLLIAGATGMGKSVCINSLITSILYKAKPDEVKLILIDPKKVELSIYNGIPHLIVPVVSEPKKAAGSLSWAVNEMERRFGLIEAVGVRDIKMFNEVTKNDPDYEFMPQIVIIIDELADLMMTAPDDVEESICRLAQKARAAGMHLIIGTQRPSVDVITGLIKANIPSRIAFTVSSQVDSRTIIDKAGAENLIGRGDMLFNPVGAQKPMRVQGAYVSETDVEEVVSYVKNMNSGNESYSDDVLAQIEQEAARCGAGKRGSQAAREDVDGEEEDPMLRSAIELAVESGKISTSLIQRRLSLGYGRAAKLIDHMERLGYVSAPDGSKPREVLITKQQFMEMVLKDET